MPVTSSRRFRFGDGYEVDLGAYELRRAGRALKLPRIPMEVLLLFIEQRGNLVTRDQIIEQVWGKEVFVDTDNSINTAVRKIRQVLKDDAEKPQFIQTVTAKGYRFIAEVTEIEGASEETSAHRQPTLRPAVNPMLPEDDLNHAEPAVDDQTQATTEGYGSRRWIVTFAVSLLVLTAAVSFSAWQRTRARAKVPGTRVMLAVLPFENLTGDAGQEYFSDGLTEEMITELGRLDPEHLGVIGRTSVMLYKRNPKPLDEIGRELGVQYVIEGSVRRDSNNVRIAAQLILVKDQTHVWARQFDRELRSLLVVQREIAQEIADEILLSLGNQHGVKSATHPVVTPAATSYEAYDLYLKGRYFWNKRSSEGFRQAIDYFQQATAKDPNYARAYAGLADTFALLSTWYMAPPAEAMPKARAAALKALEIDETLAEAHASLALIAESYDYDWPTAEKEFRRAIELNPEYATAHQWYAEYLAWQGRFGEAFTESERARQLDPMSLIIASDRGTLLYYSRQYDRAIAQCLTVLEMDPSFTHGGAPIFTSYVQEGKFTAALDEIERAHPPEDLPWTWARRTYLYGRWGRTEEAQRALARLEQLAPRMQADRIPALLMAYVGAGKNDQVIALLQEAYAGHSNAVVVLKVDPEFDPLRSDPRFTELLRRLHLA